MTAAKDDARGSGTMALHGVRVLDLTQMIAGPYCTRLFALYGAQVIKLERPRVGDRARRIGATAESTENLEPSATFLYLNTSKKSVTLNLKSAQGREIFMRLICDTDVVVENFRPGVMRRLGISYEALDAINNKLVMVSISNFGQTGPYRDYDATEMNLQAWGGLMHMAGERGREPLRLGYAAAQYEAGQNAFAASMAALLARPTMGGQHVDIAIMDTVMTSLNSAHAHYSYNQEVQGRRPAGGGKGTDRFKASDGYVIARPPRNAVELERLSKVVGESLPVDDPDAVSVVFARWVAARTKEEVMAAGQKAQFAWGALNSTQEIMQSAQIREREFFQSVDHPVAGTLPYAGAPFRMGASGTTVTAAPTLGQHTHDILCGSLGYTDDQVRHWAHEGVV